MAKYKIYIAYPELCVILKLCLNTKLTLLLVLLAVHLCATLAYVGHLVKQLTVLMMYYHECLEHTRRMNRQISILRSWGFFGHWCFLGGFVCLLSSWLSATIGFHCNCFESKLVDYSCRQPQKGKLQTVHESTLQNLRRGVNEHLADFFQRVFLLKMISSVSMLTQELLAVSPVEIGAERGSRQSGRERDGPHMCHPPVTLGHTVL